MAVENMRTGNAYKLVIGAEATYGAAVTTGLKFFPDTCEMKDETSAIEVPSKTGTIRPSACGQIKGLTKGSVTIKGSMSIGRLMLFETFLYKTDDTYTVPSAQKTNYSYTIYQLWEESTDDVVTRAKGCVLESFKLTGESSGVVQYEATFRTNGKIEREFSVTGGLTYTSLGDCEPFPMYDTTFEREGSEMKINSMSFSYNHTFADDNKIFQNSAQKTFDLITGCESSVEVEWNYARGYADTSLNDSVIYDNLLSATLKTLNFIFIDASGREIKMVSKGKYMTYDSPDPDKGIYTGKVTQKLLDNGVDEMLEFNVSV